MQITVVVDESIKEGQTAAYVDYMREMIKITKTEEGNIAYDLYEAVDGSGDVVMVEIWESQEALDKHMKSEHFQKFVPGGDAFKTAPSNVRVFSRL